MRRFHEGPSSGPRPTGWLERWTEAEQQLTRARAVKDPVRIRVFTDLARVALALTVDGRGN